MRVIDRLYRYAPWLNLAAILAVVLWLGWAGTVLPGLSERSASQSQILRACPCQTPATPQRSANRI